LKYDEAAIASDDLNSLQDVRDELTRDGAT
jgi:hypothetical protein